VEILYPTLWSTLRRRLSVRFQDKHSWPATIDILNDAQRLMLRWRERWSIYLATIFVDRDLEDHHYRLGHPPQSPVVCTFASWLPCFQFRGMS
jgi:hypothetical protein